MERAQTGDNSGRRFRFSESSIYLVKDAMNGLQHDVEYSTTYKNFHNYPFELGMKTGTAEVQDSSSKNISIDSLFVCFAPLSDPKLFSPELLKMHLVIVFYSCKKSFNQYFGIESLNPLEFESQVDSEITPENNSENEF